MTTSITTTESNTTVPSPKVRRLRALLPRDLYRRVAVQAAREEAAPNSVVVRALGFYLDHVEKQACP
jgi:hypothetical protein